MYRGGVFSPTLFSGTLASGTLLALTGVLDDRLLVSFVDDGLRRLLIAALAAPDRCCQPWFWVREICATLQVGLLALLNLCVLRALDWTE